MNAVLIFSLLIKVAVLQQIPDADDQLHIYALPVGQGDCTVIQCPKAYAHDKKGLVTIIDAGASNSKGIDAQGIINFLAGTRINFAVLTHSHKDHLKYMNDVLKSYNQKVNVYHPCDWSSYGVSDDYAVSKEVPRCIGIPDCKKHVSELALCPNVDIKLSFVASAVGGCNNNKANNEDSLISKITYGTVSTLITGDFELGDSVMEAFLGTAGPDLSSQIYRLSHHGSLGANPVPFLDAVGASFVFSSSGFRYGHPRCEVYNYYHNKLPDDVAEHPYTCFRQLSGNQYAAENGNIRKAIYVTSLYRKGPGDNWIKSYYIVKFDIGKDGKIGVEFTYIGDDVQNYYYYMY